MSQTFILYHGTNSLFKRFEESKSRILNDFYGGGVAYFTADKRIAATYAKNMSKKSGQPLIYTVQCTFNKVFDTEKDFFGEELVDLLPQNVDEFARGARLLKYGVDKYDVISKLKTGDMTLTGDQIFYGLSSGMTQTRKAREILKDKGYDALRHVGGVNMQQKILHDVYIAYHADDIKIQKVEKMVIKESLYPDDEDDEEQMTLYRKEYAKQIEEGTFPINHPFKLKCEDTKKFGVYVLNNEGNKVLIKYGNKKLNESGLVKVGQKNLDDTLEGTDELVDKYKRETPGQN